MATLPAVNAPAGRPPAADYDSNSIKILKGLDAVRRADYLVASLPDDVGKELSSRIAVVDNQYFFIHVAAPQTFW